MVNMTTPMAQPNVFYMMIDLKFRKNMVNFTISIIQGLQTYLRVCFLALFIVDGSIV